MSKEVIKNRYSFILLFSAHNSNPNGNPDAGNLPRTDPATGIAYISPQCMKHKIRNEIALIAEGKEGYKMYISPDMSLNEKDSAAYVAAGLDPKKIDSPSFKKNNPNIEKELLNWMCSNYYDVRAFGAVMTSFSKAKLSGCANVRGPIQVEYSESCSPVDIMDMKLTRCAQSTESDFTSKGSNTMGNATIIPYALFTMRGTINPYDARNTGFTEDDLEMFWTACENIFMHDHSASRSGMRVHKFIVFKHESAYGNAQDADLYDRLVIKEKVPGAPIRKYGDYEVSLNKNDLPKGISLVERI